MLTENKITDLLASHLELKGYKIKQKLTSTQKGVDLIVEDHDGVRIYFEVKGETSALASSKRFDKPFTGNQIWSHVGVALLKTLTLMNEHDGKGLKFGMAFPFNHEHLINRIISYTDRLDITIFLVSEEEVKRVSA